MTDLLRTPLWQLHKQLGGKLINFGGWDMPVQYTAGTLLEHKTVRTAVGLFDVSHMGEVILRGPNARAAVDKLATNAVAAAPAGKAVYSLLCREDGGIVDDCIFYKRSDNEYFVIVNASNTSKDLAWMREQIGSMVDIENVSAATALIAVQGPRAIDVVAALGGQALRDLGSFTFADCELAGVKCIAARTGYTGEDGFELACSNEGAPRLWMALVEACKPFGGLPIGLGARDSLRLESRLPLYGNDLDDTTTPLEAGLGWAVKLDGRTFLGSETLSKQKAGGVTRKLTGFRIAESTRAIPRHGYAIRHNGADVGVVTSGGLAITAGGAIALGYVPTHVAAETAGFTIDCRGKDVAADPVIGKFYKRTT